MSRKIGSVGARTAESIREAGVRLIFTHGFEAMTLRQLAAAVGVQASSLYNHIPSKQALLFAIMRDYMTDLLAAVDGAVEADADPIARLRQFVAFHVRYHIARKRDLRIVNLELRSLEPGERAEIVAMRDDYERRLSDILEAGQAAGRLDVADVRVATFAILAMLTGIAAWWRPDGRLTVEELVAVHQDLVLGTVRGRRRVASRGPGV
jgi:AcrR family transcriptional regulator